MGRLHQQIGTDSRPRSDAAEHIKAVARRLFAERGVDGVTVREIATASGQKNHAAVGYHFGSKEALVREIVVDGAMLINDYRNLRLDALESREITVSDIVDILITPAAKGTGGQDDYMRFVAMLAMTHRDLFMDALADRWNSGYLRCLDHLRRLMPPMSRAVQNQRFVFLAAYLSSVLSRREAALADLSRAHPIWSSESTLVHFTRTVIAMLQAPITVEVSSAASEDANHDDTQYLTHSPVG